MNGKQRELLSANSEMDTARSVKKMELPYKTDGVPVTVTVQYI